MITFPGLIGSLAASTVVVSLALAPTEARAQAGPVTGTHDVGLTVSEVATLRIEGASAPSFSITSPETAGAAPSISTDTAARYLQFTSVVTGSQTRKITVAHDNDVPNGLTLTLNLDPTVANGAKGATGERAAAALALTNTAQDAITLVGSGYTGTGATEGWKFTYSLNPSPADLSASWTAIKSVSKTITVTYTLTAGQ